VTPLMAARWRDRVTGADVIDLLPQGAARRRIERTAATSISAWELLERGAAVAGATDTQGDAPKFRVLEDEHGEWHPDSGEIPFRIRRHALLKFPVSESGPRAADILRHEAAYQRVAARAGLRVTSPLPEFTDGALLIPRFDRRVIDGREIRLGVESLYSICGVLDPALTVLRHDQVLIALTRCVSDFRTELIEYLRSLLSG
jgi:serine/threonine-protein kinase HipA